MINPIRKDVVLTPPSRPVAGRNNEWTFSFYIPAINDGAF
jgi:hypothetical protein